MFIGFIMDYIILILQRVEHIISAKQFADPRFVTKITMLYAKITNKNLMATREAAFVSSEPFEKKPSCF